MADLWAADLNRRQTKPHVEVWAERREAAVAQTAARMDALTLEDRYDRIENTRQGPLTPR